MLNHLKRPVTGDTLDLLRGAASLIQGRCSVFSHAMELNRAKIKTRLVSPPDGIEATLRQRLTVASADNVKTLAVHGRQFIGENGVQWNS